MRETRSLDAYTPVLGRVPDARRAPIPLFPPAVLGYLALMLGAGVAGTLALWNALALRRAGVALVSLALGLVGWAGYGAVIVATASSGVKNVAVLLLLARVFSLAIGIVLAWHQTAQVRGHSFLDGRTVPLLPCIVAGLVLSLLLPWRVLLVLMGYWPLLSRG
ncbi:MAG: hypothetical protein ACREBE_04060 [bacterium]